ncbi:addiction module protein [Thiohalocapsa marina]|uniref:addiction module protein n=1 Tax=Thiohalocapsa marina TaxID=424902 RepID=UPI0036DD111B
MPIPIEALEAELLRLPAVERARLLDRVIASLDRDREHDAAWDRLAAERDAEIEHGTSAPVSGTEAIARLRAALR